MRTYSCLRRTFFIWPPWGPQGGFGSALLYGGINVFLHCRGCFLWFYLRVKGLVWGEGVVLALGLVDRRARHMIGNLRGGRFPGTHRTMRGILRCSGVHHRTRRGLSGGGRRTGRFTGRVNTLVGRNGGRRTRDTGTRMTVLGTSTGTLRRVVRGTRGSVAGRLLRVPGVPYRRIPRNGSTTSGMIMGRNNRGPGLNTSTLYR